MVDCGKFKKRYDQSLKIQFEIYSASSEQTRILAHQTFDVGLEEHFISKIVFIIVILRSNNRLLGLSKTEIFSEEQNRIAVLAKVLGHPARVAILQQLFKMESCICGDLVSEIGLAQPTISQHLKELKYLGLIKGSVEGTSVCYCIDQKGWSEMKILMGKFLDQDIQQQEDCC